MMFKPKHDLQMSPEQLRKVVENFSEGRKLISTPQQLAWIVEKMREEGADDYVIAMVTAHLLCKSRMPSYSEIMHNAFPIEPMPAGANAIYDGDVPLIDWDDNYGEFNGVDAETSQHAEEDSERDHNA